MQTWHGLVVACNRRKSWKSKLKRQQNLMVLTTKRQGVTFGEMHFVNCVKFLGRTQPTILPLHVVRERPASVIVTCNLTSHSNDYPWPGNTIKVATIDLTFTFDKSTNQTDLLTPLANSHARSRTMLSRSDTTGSIPRYGAMRRPMVVCGSDKQIPL